MQFIVLFQSTAICDVYQRKLKSANSLDFIFSDNPPKLL